VVLRTSTPAATATFILFKTDITVLHYYYMPSELLFTFAA
jgi:hypothetical protein